MAIVRIATSHAFYVSQVSPYTVTVPASASGHLLAVAIRCYTIGDDSAIASITDNVGNTYVEAPGALSPSTSSVPEMTTIWYAKNSTAGATTVTISTVKTALVFGAVVVEYSGADLTAPLETANSVIATVTPEVGAPITTASGTSLLLNVIYCGSGTDQAGVQSPWVDLRNASNEGDTSQYLPGLAGTYAPTYDQVTPGAYRYVSSGASFLAASTPVTTAKHSMELVF